MTEERRAARRQQVYACLEAKNYPELRGLLREMNPADIGSLFEDIEPNVQPVVFRLLPKATAAVAFSYMEAEEQENLLRSFTDKELEDVMREMYIDDAVDFIEEMPASVVWRILRHTDPEMRAALNQLLQYPKDSAGSIMTPEFVDLRKNMTVREAFGRIRATGLDKETVYTCYVIDDTRHLEGIVTVKDLLLSPLDATMEQIMQTHVIYAKTTQDQEEVAGLLEKYDFLAVPVVDGEQRLVGIVTIDDAIDVIQEEATEDIEKMAAIVPGDKPYIRQSVFELYKSRIPWLLLLMV
ncbi:MAG: magnesium transporter, partial [Clostridia bacterium]|nr:magnesium transporter [Clostridia bacterium]